MFFTILVIIIAVSGITIAVSSLTNKEKSSWVQFYAKGKDSGFSFKEIELLKKLAIKSSIEEPSSLFWSQNQLDICIRSLVKTMQLPGGTVDQESQDFLSKLYDFRKKIEMGKPQAKNGIFNSRQITDGQKLKVLVRDSGVFKSQIVKNTNDYITISRPTTTKFPENFLWQGQKLSVYFWREEDAGYVFDADVLDEVFSKGIASLKITHSDSLFRTQKRKSVRLKTHRAAFLYQLQNEEEAHTIELNPGLKCFMEDLSDNGCAIIVNGKAMSGIRIKIQFALNNTPVCMSGIIRSVEFKEEVNRSLLHVEADPLPIETRNQILGEVFGTLPDDDEELPFRMLGEEAEEIIAEPAGSDEIILDFSGEDDTDKIETAI